MRPPSSNLQEIRDKLKSYKIDWNHRIFSLEPQAHWKGFVPWKLCLMRPDLWFLGAYLILHLISAGLRVDQKPCSTATRGNGPVPRHRHRHLCASRSEISRGFFAELFDAQEALANSWFNETQRRRSLPNLEGTGGRAQLDDFCERIMWPFQVWL